MKTYSQDFESTPFIFPHLDRTLQLTTFSNHRVNITSRWSAPPSSDVDAAWTELGVKDQIILLPGNLGRQIGLDPKRHVYAPMGAVGEEKEGFGVFVQGMHDLHCLNEMRKALYFNKDYYRQFEDDTLTPEWSRRSHIRHCLDTIRETLQCSASTTLIPTVWISPSENYPQFGRQHKCHSYEAMINWFNAWHHAPENQNINWTVHLNAPPDAVFTDPLLADWS
ncbi:Putative mycotoxin biosynthesis protein UstYa [Septoria linicola]|uniref:Mycotoxin biosynthesis protein UstYa n=1 Tax=Septoria linicola TaxID=215465 RepID=A0A9Q9AIE1_9PEZI|nr:Putative mycotoxin biosynthesis protein UstYa [Septoria linicola]